jgi:dipeptidyl aminopeptidase/acylaminoacyl peptidase
MIRTSARPARHLLLPAGLAAVLALPAAAAAQPTLERLLASAFPTGLAASPVDGAVAWVQYDRGVRNIWFAAGPDYTARMLTAYTEDDGQDLGSLVFSPDGRTLVYVRGGGPNRQGEHPNPAQLPDGAEQALWRVDVAGGAPIRIGAGSSPAIAPTGDVVAFLRGGQVWSAPLDGSAEPSILFRVRGGAGSLRWSPDGGTLAFVSGRGTHAFIGLFERAGRRIRFLDPSVDRDGNPVFSPDGRSIAWLRTPASSANTLFRAVREAQPWSIRVADVATGASREVFRARPGTGSAFRGVVAENQLFWTADDRIVFPWERDGWTHLFSVPPRGGEPVQLTPGAFEVEYVTLAADGRTIVYNSNQDDIDRRHLWQVPAAGGTPRRLTTGPTISWEPTPTRDGRAIAFFRADARRPAHAAIMIDGRTRDLAPGSIPTDFPLDALVEPQAVMIPASDGMLVPGQLFLPRDLRPGERRPAIAYFHGGSRRQMLLGWHYSSYYHNAYALNQYLAARGYIVLSVNFRSGTGYGMEFREALNYGAGGASEFHDVLGAGLWLRGRPDVDPDRIGLWGGSYGGYLTAMGLSRASGLYAAGVDIHGVHDWNVGIQTFVPSYNPLEDPDAARTAFLSSPMSSLDTWRSPVLVISGDDDRNVRFLETVNLVEALRERNVHVEQLVFPDEVHSFLLHRNWLAAYEATADFFDRMLRGRR